MRGLVFKTIQLDRHFDECIELRAISYQASYGSMHGFEASYGEPYRSRLANKIKQLPEGNCHVWKDGVIIGQIEAKFIDDPSVGYVNLLCLKPDFQMQGLGVELLLYLSNVFKNHNKRFLHLSVSPTNLAALAFYRKHGWNDQGPRPSKPSMILMQYPLK